MPKLYASQTFVALNKTASFLHIISQMKRFSEKREHKLCLLISSSSFVWNISHSRKNSRKYYYKFT